MQKFLMGILLVLLSMTSGVKSAQGAPDSVQQLATSLRLLAEPSGQESFIDQLSAAIGKEHLHLLDPERNIYEIDVLQQEEVYKKLSAIYCTWNIYALYNLLMGTGPMAENYQRLVSRQAFNEFARKFNLFWAATNPQKQLFENAIAQNDWLAAAKTWDKNEDYPNHSNFAYKQYHGAVLWPEYDKLLPSAVWWLASGVVPKLDVEAFFAGSRAIEGYSFNIYSEYHEAIFYVYRDGTQIYGFYADSIAGRQWKDGKWKKFMQDLIDAWREAARKRGQ